MPVTIVRQRLLKRSFAAFVFGLLFSAIFVSYYHYKSHIHILLRKNGAELGQSTTSWEAEIDKNQSNKKIRNSTVLADEKHIYCDIAQSFAKSYLYDRCPI